MMTNKRRRAVLLLALWAAVPSAVGAGAVGQESPVRREDARNVRSVVQAQLDAFAADDAERAFALAAPNIRELFGSAGKFIAMVRSGYPVVYRPASVEFLLPQIREGELIQSVRMTDRRGAVWLAVYLMQRQPDKSWLIAGCTAAEVEGRVT